ncbi:RagB/SusD family nutrient uptake outer membrane protein [Flagellimonas sp.]|uniref:RagB/SusD family nutrient uptake outer membrane protein n=1 Tax=Flagellimonas sp. TaxID=2058762 RepID=UPI003BAF1A1C
MRKTIDKIKAIGLIVLTITISSCDKDLDLAPLDQLSPATFWKSGDDWKYWANNFYNGLGGHGNGTLDLNSDLSMGQGTNAVSAGNNLVPQSDDAYSNPYGGIRSINIALAQYEEALPEIQSEAERYVAELRFFRAWTYFGLLKSYGGVILVDKPLEINSEELFAARSSRTAITDFIISDLDWASSRLPGYNELVGADIGRISSEAALAFKSRVALFEGTWQKYHGGNESDRFLDMAINAANAVVNSGAFELFDDYGADSYYFLFLDEGEGSSETILARRYDAAINSTHNTSRWVDTQHAAPTKNLADLYLCTDGLPISDSPLFQGRATLSSEFEDRDWRMLGTIMKPGTVRNVDGDDIVQQPAIGTGNGLTNTGYQSRKFLANGANATSGAQTYDFMAIRYAEVLLNLAEALYEKDGNILDADLNRTINLLRTRAGVANLTNAFVTVNSLDMLEEIRRERSVELAYEGFRFDDLRRWQTAENVLPVALRGVQFEGTEFETEYPDVTVNVDGDGFIIADDASVRQFAQKNYLFPIPTDEIQLNENLEQNPGW